MSVIHGKDGWPDFDWPQYNREEAYIRYLCPHRAFTRRVPVSEEGTASWPDEWCLTCGSVMHKSPVFLTRSKAATWTPDILATLLGGVGKNHGR